MSAENLAPHILDEMGAATFAIDCEHRVILWNKSCARLTGLDALSVLGTSDHWRGFYKEQRPCLADLALSKGTDAVAAHYARDRRGGDAATLRAENWCDLPSGARVYLTIEARPVRDASGAVVAIVETLQDSTAHEAEQALATAQAEALAGERSSVLAAFGDGIEKLAARNLSFRITGRLPEAYEKLRNDFNAAVDALTEVVTGVAASSHALQAGTSQISAASEDLSRRTERQAASLSQTTSALSEITGTIRETAGISRHARNLVGRTSDASRKGIAAIRQAVDAIAKIAKSSQQVEQIIGAIDEIAFQTNLLALNAGVEAARAGDAGRGFAVVASEVRALAQRSAAAAREIKGLIAASSTQVREGVALVAHTGEAFEQIETGVNEISGVIEQIAKSAEQEATGLQEVDGAMRRLDQTNRQNAALSEDSCIASASLAEQGSRLAELIGQFRIRAPEETGRARGEKPNSPIKVAPRPTAVEDRRSAQPRAGAVNGGGHARR